MVPRNKRSKASAAKAVDKLAVEKYLSQASEACESGDLTTARKMYNAALQATNNKDPAVLDAFGEFLLEIGEAKEAEALFSRSLEIAPHYSTLLNRALCRGATPGAVQDVERAGGMIEGELASAQNRNDGEAAAIAAAAAAAAACQLCELWCTPPLCDAPEAQARAEGARDTALRHGENIPDVLATAAQTDWLTGKPDSALELARRAVAIMAAYPALMSPVEPRLQLARLLLELGAAQPAAAVADSVIAENKGLLDAYYVSARAYNDFGQYATARERLGEWLAAAQAVSAQAAAEVMRASQPIVDALGDAANEDYEPEPGLQLA